MQCHSPRQMITLSTCLMLASCAHDRSWTPLDANTAAPDSAASSTWRTIGHSIENRPIQAATTGYGPFRLLIITGIHGSEREGQAAADPLLELLSQPSLQPLATTTIIRDANPDGSANGTRGNARGVDLNRNWPATNFRPGRRRGKAPLSEPETAALAAEMNRFKPDLVIVFHATSSGPFVDSDGPGESDANAFVQAARAIDPRWRHNPDYTNPPGSLGSYLGLDLNRPILTVEFQSGQDRDLSVRAAIAGIKALVERRR